MIEAPTRAVGENIEVRDRALAAYMYVVGCNLVQVDRNGSRHVYTFENDDLAAVAIQRWTLGDAMVPAKPYSDALRNLAKGYIS